MRNAIVATFLATLIAACSGYGDERPEPTTGGFERAPAGTTPPAQPPDNYP